MYAVQYFIAKLTFTAASTSSITSLSNLPIFSLNLFLSIVLNCSKRITEFFGSGTSLALTLTWVGNFALLSWDVIAATIVVGEYLLPMSFWTTTTGLTPPSSEPIEYIPSFYHHNFSPFKAREILKIELWATFITFYHNFHKYIQIIEIKFIFYKYLIIYFKYIGMTKFIAIIISKGIVYFLVSFKLYFVPPGR